MELGYPSWFGDTEGNVVISVALRRDWPPQGARICALGGLAPTVGTRLAITRDVKLRNSGPVERGNGVARWIKSGVRLGRVIQPGPVVRVSACVGRRFLGPVTCWPIITVNLYSGSSAAIITLGDLRPDTLRHHLSMALPFFSGWSMRT